MRGLGVAVDADAPEPLADVALEEPVFAAPVLAEPELALPVSSSRQPIIKMIATTIATMMPMISAPKNSNANIANATIAAIKPNNAAIAMMPLFRGFDSFILLVSLRMSVLDEP